MIVLPDHSYRVPVAELVDPAAAIAALGFETGDPAELARLRAAEYFLVRNDGPERWTCANCGQRHAHYTKLCIPRPWQGLERALYGYWVNVGATHPGELTPAQRARLARLAPLFGGKAPAQTLAASHPQTAHMLGTNERDVETGATVLGSLDPISRAQAATYANQINARARRIVIRI